MARATSILTALLLSAAPLWSPAQPLSINNPGFEADLAPPGAFIVGLPSGWSAHDPGGILNGNSNALGSIPPLPGTEYFPASAALWLAGLLLAWPALARRRWRQHSGV